MVLDCKCVPQKVSPNGNYGIDAAINMLVNVMANAQTNPFDNGWYYTNVTGKYEIADQCADSFPDAKTLPSGAKYNIEYRKLKYYIQGSWDPAEKKCFIA